MNALEMIFEGLGIWAANIQDLHLPAVAALAALLIVGISIATIGVRRHQKPIISAEETEAPALLPNVLEHVPFPVWSTLGGKVAFTNANYHNTAALSDNSEGIFTYSKIDSSGRNMVNIDGQQRWFTTTEIQLDDETYTLALPADELVSAQASLKRLMETLSTTFAHLPVGLVIFDADKTLTQFNPAITTLLDLNPTWLAMRPTMSALLERLRENHHLPEHLNFLEWRRLLTNMSATSPNNTYADDWHLPNGTSLRVTGQAHSQGAITFLFEDITAQITLERQHHAEIALNQAVLDRVSDAIAVISPAATITFTNASFDHLFGLRSADSLAIPDINTLATSLPETVAFWNKLRGFVSQSKNRAPWAATLDLSGEKSVDVYPMPDGATLVSFAYSGRLTEGQKIKSIFQVLETL